MLRLHHGKEGKGLEGGSTGSQFVSCGETTSWSSSSWVMWYLWFGSIQVRFHEKRQTHKEDMDKLRLFVEKRRNRTR